MEKSRFAESLLDVLKENQRTLNHVIRLSGSNVESEVEDELPSQKQYQPQIQSNGHNANGVSISEVLEKMSELIELNKVTLQTIDLLDKRIKRLHSVVDTKLSTQTSSQEAPQQAEEQIDEYA